MSFTRKTITLALAGMVGAGFTGAALANDVQQGLTPNTPPQAYSSQSPSDLSASQSQAGVNATQSTSGMNATQSSSGNDQGATADEANRATSKANAPADRLPSNRGQAGDSSSATGTSGTSGATGTSGSTSSSANGIPGRDAGNLDHAKSGSAAGNANALYQGNEDAKAVTREMSDRYNAADLNASQGTDTSTSPNAGNLPQGHPPVEVYRRSTTIYMVPDQPGQSMTSGSAMESQSSGTTSSSQGSAGTSASSGSMSTDQRFDALTGSGSNDTGAVTGASGGLRNDTSGNASERSSNLNDRNGSNANASSQWSSPASAESSGTSGNP